MAFQQDDICASHQLLVGCGYPLSLGIGPTKIRGSAYIEGPMLVGNIITYPLLAEANLMVARCSNIDAIPPPPSIFKVSTRGLAPTPLDVMLGDPTGHVGITVNSTIISIFNDTNISIISPFTTGVGVLNWVGAKTFAGAVAEAGVEARTGTEAVGGSTCDSGAKIINGPLIVNGPITAPILNGYATGNKSFDIPHVKNNQKRIRHICVEGPEAAVYIRGKLENDNIIELPEYWDGLIDPESITVTLTQIGYSQDLIVEKIEWGKRVKIKSGTGSNIKCYYEVWATRWINPMDHSEKLHVVYDGDSPDDYPGNKNSFLVGGWDYDKRNPKWK